MTKIKRIRLSLDEDRVSTLCQRRWSSSAWTPPPSPSPTKRSPPPTMASFSTGWTLLTCTQEARSLDELWFLILLSLVKTRLDRVPYSLIVRLEIDFPHLLVILSMSHHTYQRCQWCLVLFAQSETILGNIDQWKGGATQMATKVIFQCWNLYHIKEMSQERIFDRIFWRVTQCR